MAEHNLINALEAVDLSYCYPDGTTALNCFNVRLQAGKRLAVVGPNGAGKTTLMLLLAGFYPPQAGRATVFGIDVCRSNIAKIRSLIGFVFQNPDDQLFMPTVLNDIAFGPLNAGIDPKAALRMSAEALEDMGIGILAQKTPAHLSAGEKRLAALAGALVSQPPMLVLDEPTASLDPSARRTVINHLSQRPQTQIIITHDLELVLELGSEMILMHRGRSIVQGDPRQLLADESLMKAHGLEVPLSLRM